MNTISIDSKVYKGAEICARLHNTNVKEFIEKAIIAAVGNNNQKAGAKTIKAESELSPQVRSLIGIARDVKAGDINGRDERLEFLMEKQ